jgi:multisubunit Na+/H+ antiporter MnhB subunit
VGRVTTGEKKRSGTQKMKQRDWIILVGVIFAVVLIVLAILLFTLPDTDSGTRVEHEPKVDDEDGAGQAAADV